MNVEGLTPGKGPSADRLGGAKRPPPAPGKSFADALKKAAQAAPATPVESAAAPAPAAAKLPPPPPTDDHIGTIKYRMQTGYYNNPKIDDALSDKLSGFFDEIA